MLQKGALHHPHIPHSLKKQNQKRITTITQLMGHLMSHSGTTGHTSTLPPTDTRLLSSLGDRTYIYKLTCGLQQIAGQAGSPAQVSALWHLHQILRNKLEEMSKQQKLSGKLQSVHVNLTGVKKITP